MHVLEGRLRVFSGTDEYLSKPVTPSPTTVHPALVENPDDRAAVILGSVIPLAPLPRPRLG
ncbi:MAG: hypothetical protein R2742_05330 [Micropruina glycogenica]